MNRLFLVAAAIFFVTTAIWFWQTLPKTPAPELIFKTIKGEQLSLRALRGSPVLINFWASDCQSCIEEIPDLIALHQEYQSKNLKIIAIAMPYDPPNRVVAINAEFQLPYAVALDIEGKSVAAFGQVQLTPSTFLLDQQGSVVFRKLGRIDLNALRSQLNTM